LEGHESNRDGIGAAVKMVPASGAAQYATVSTAGSYLSASDRRVHFGLGADESARSVEIRWPSGITQRLENVKANQILTVAEPDRGAREPQAATIQNSVGTMQNSERSGCQK
jgi:uncharacterized protein YggU (UPF0235/DUF167 family)